LEFLIIRKRDLEKDLDVTQKDPINTLPKKNTRDRVESVFLGVDNYPINPYILLYERKK
jgi:hypothetical protein